MFCHPKDATWPHLDDWKGRFSSFVIQKDATWPHFDGLGRLGSQKSKTSLILSPFYPPEAPRGFLIMMAFGRVDFEVLSSKRCYLTSSWWLEGVDFQVLSSKRCNLTSFWWLWKAGFSEKWNPHWFSPHLEPPGPPGASSSWWLLEE